MTLKILHDTIDSAGWVSIGLRSDGKTFYGRGGSREESRRVLRRAARLGRVVKTKSRYGRLWNER